MILHLIKKYNQYRNIIMLTLLQDIWVFNTTLALKIAIYTAMQLSAAYFAAVEILTTTFSFFEFFFIIFALVFFLLLKLVVNNTFLSTYLVKKNNRVSLWGTTASFARLLKAKILTWGRRK